MLPRIADVPLWPTISGAVFLLFFLGLLYWVYRGDRRRTYEAVQDLVFDDEESAGKENLQKSTKESKDV